MSYDVLALENEINGKHPEVQGYDVFIKKLQALVIANEKRFSLEERPLQTTSERDISRRFIRQQSAFMKYVKFVRQVEDLDTSNEDLRDILKETPFMGEVLAPEIDQNLKSQFTQKLKNEQFWQTFKKNWESKLPDLIEQRTSLCLKNARWTEALLMTVLPWQQEHPTADMLFIDPPHYAETFPENPEERCSFLLTPNGLTWTDRCIPYLQTLLDHYAGIQNVERPTVGIYDNGLPGKEREVGFIEVNFKSPSAKQAIVVALVKDCSQPFPDRTHWSSLGANPDSNIGIQQRRYWEIQQEEIKASEEALAQNKPSDNSDSPHPSAGLSLRLGSAVTMLSAESPLSDPPSPVFSSDVAASPVSWQQAESKRSELETENEEEVRSTKSPNYFWV